MNDRIKMYANKIIFGQRYFYNDKEDFQIEIILTYKVLLMYRMIYYSWEDNLTTQSLVSQW